MNEIRRSEQVQVGRALRLDRRAALELLRDLARDGAVLSDLRKLWARETGRSALCFASNNEVLDQLAARVASGALIIARVHLPLSQARPPLEGAADGQAAAGEAVAAAGEAAAAKEEEEPPDELLESVDVAAQVATLEQAAKDGTPFCEECDKHVAVVNATATVSADTAQAPPDQESPDEEKNDQERWLEIELVDDGKPAQSVPGAKYVVEMQDGTLIKGTLDGKGTARIKGIKGKTVKVSFPELDSEDWR